MLPTSNIINKEVYFSKYSLMTCHKHFKNLTSFASSLVFISFIRNMADVISLIYVGKLHDNTTTGAMFIGASTLGEMMCNVTGFSLGYGLTSSLDTLISQAYGAKKYSLCGTIAQRAILILTLCSIPVTLVWMRTEWLLINVLGIDNDIAYLAGIWSRYLTLGLWPSLMFSILEKYLQGQNLLWPCILATTLGTVSCICFNHILISKYHLGYEGAAMSIPLSQWFALISFVFIIICRKKWISRKKYATNSNNNNNSNSSRRMCIEISEVGNTYRKELDIYSLVSSNVDDEIDSNNTDSININYNSDDNNQIIPSITTSNDFNTARYRSNSTIKDDATLINKTLLNISNNNNKSNNNLNELEDLSTTNQYARIDPEDNWPEINIEILYNWNEILLLGLPGALSLFLEWGMYELAAGISGKLGATSLAVHGIYMTTSSLFYMFPYSIASSTGTLAGNFLGEERCVDATSVTTLGMVLSLVYGLSVSLFMFFIGRHFWGSLFTHDQSVIQEIYDTAPIFSIYLFVDCPKCITLNVLRSIGRPAVTVFGNIFVMGCIIFPCSYYFGIVLNYGINGIWGSMATAWASAAIVYFIVLYRTDWNSLLLIKK